MKRAEYLQQLANIIQEEIRSVEDVQIESYENFISKLSKANELQTDGENKMQVNSLVLELNKLLADRPQDRCPHERLRLFATGSCPPRRRHRPDGVCSLDCCKLGSARQDQLCARVVRGRLSLP